MTKRRRNPASMSSGDGGSSDNEMWLMLGGAAILAYIWYTNNTTPTTSTGAYGGYVTPPNLPEGLNINSLVGTATPISLTNPNSAIWMTPSLQELQRRSQQTLPSNELPTAPYRMLQRAMNNLPNNVTIANPLPNTLMVDSALVEEMPLNISTQPNYFAGGSAGIFNGPIAQNSRLFSPISLNGLNPSKPNLSETVNLREVA